MFFVALPTPERNKGGRHRSSRLRRRIITGMPYVNKRMNVIFLPAFSDIPTTITFAEAPIAEPVPPRQAPKHQHRAGERDDRLLDLLPDVWRGSPP
jgi:hypothetical protein